MVSISHPREPFSNADSFARMVLYFPVSALVTLFGNILQNPLDPRARSDTRLMNVVVNFLSMLGHEAEQGGVHRILAVCAEFERIAKAVIDKAEKEHSTRRKRKNQESSSSNGKPTNTTTGSSNNADSPSFNPNATMQTPRPMTASSSTPQPTGAAVNSGNMASPGINMSSRGYSPMNPAAMSQSPSPGMTPAGWQNHLSAANGGTDTSDYASFADLAGFGSAMGGGPMEGVTRPPLGPGGIFQQPMLPPDLFSLPVTLDWDWAEMSGGAYPSVENGNFGGGGGGDGGLQQHQAHHHHQPR